MKDASYKNVTVWRRNVHAMNTFFWKLQNWNMVGLKCKEKIPVESHAIGIRTVKYPSFSSNRHLISFGMM